MGWSRNRSRAEPKVVAPRPVSLVMLGTSFPRDLRSSRFRSARSLPRSGSRWRLQSGRCRCSHRGRIRRHSDARRIRCPLRRSGCRRRYDPGRAGRVVVSVASQEASDCPGIENIRVDIDSGDLCLPEGARRPGQASSGEWSRPRVREDLPVPRLNAETDPVHSDLTHSAGLGEIKGARVGFPASVPPYPRCRRSRRVPVIRRARCSALRRLGVPPAQVEGSWSDRMALLRHPRASARMAETRSPWSALPRAGVCRSLQ